MHELTFHVAALPRNVQDGPLHVALYEAPASPGIPRIGGPVLEAVRRLGVTPSAVSFDLLTVALAVTAADTFMRRAVASDVGWGRELHLSVPVGNPDALSAVSPLLREALGFLTGDRWEFDFREDGIAPPAPMRHGAALNLRGVDSVSLFSGGLDSAIGVLDLVPLHSGFDRLAPEAVRPGKGCFQAERCSGQGLGKDNSRRSSLGSDQ